MLRCGCSLVNEERQASQWTQEVTLSVCFTPAKPRHLSLIDVDHLLISVRMNLLKDQFSQTSLIQAFHQTAGEFYQKVYIQSPIDQSDTLELMSCQQQKVWLLIKLIMKPAVFPPTAEDWIWSNSWFSCDCTAPGGGVIPEVFCMLHRVCQLQAGLITSEDASGLWRRRERRD